MGLMARVSGLIRILFAVLFDHTKGELPFDYPKIFDLILSIRDFIDLGICLFSIGNPGTHQCPPQFGIGQRVFLIQTPAGNVLWDLLVHLDDETIMKIKAMGGLHAIVISHPHYYSNYVQWAHVFQCPVYFSPEDAQWVDRQDVKDVERRWIQNQHEAILPGITAIKCGGHFDGSLALHWDEFGGVLFIADTMFTVPVSNFPVTYSLP